MKNNSGHTWDAYKTGKKGAQDSYENYQAQSSKR